MGSNIPSGIHEAIEENTNFIINRHNNNNRIITAKIFVIFTDNSQTRRKTMTRTFIVLSLAFGVFAAHSKLLRGQQRRLETASSTAALRYYKESGTAIKWNNVGADLDQKDISEYSGIPSSSSWRSSSSLYYTYLSDCVAVCDAESTCEAFVDNHGKSPPYCVFKQSTNTYAKSSKDTYIKPRTKDATCTSASPCGLGEGDCNSDDECAGDLHCFQRGAEDPLPGIHFSSTDHFESSTDFCFDSNTGFNNAHWSNYISCGSDSDHLCDIGQGDCGDHNDCKSGLLCWDRDATNMMPPGVVASRDSHLSGQADYCYDPNWTSNNGEDGAPLLSCKDSPGGAVKSNAVVDALLINEGVERVGISGVDFNTWGEDTQMFDTPAQVQVATANDDPHTTGVQKATEGFQWSEEDNADESWYPQGLTINRDPSSNVELIAAWYSKGEEGARVTLVQRAENGQRKYVHVLLVQEKGLSGCTTSVSDAFEPLWKFECSGSGQVHVGGITVSPDGKFLLAADSQDGIRGFELDNIVKVDETDTMLGYKYALPQTLYWKPEQLCGADPLSTRNGVWAEAYADGDDFSFSFLALDSFNSEKPRLLTGMYDKTGDGMFPTLMWFDIGQDAAGHPTFKRPEGVSLGHLFSQGYFQGAVVDPSSGDILVARSSVHELSRINSERTEETEVDWGYGPEDMEVTEDGLEFWCQSEHPNERTVWKVSFSDTGH